jgi:hypothetical protein
VRLASRELEKLEPRLSHIVVEVPPKVRLPGLVVRRGDATLAEAAWGVAVPVDPGDHTLTASAPGYHDWSTRVAVREAERAILTLPALEKAPPPPPAPKPAPAAVAEQPDGKSQRMLGYAVGGAGVVAIGVGAYFGFSAIGKAKESEEHCSGSLCSPRGLEISDDANRAATIANVAIGLGLVAVGAGTYLVLTAPSAAQIGKGGGSILVSGTW